MTKTLRNVMGGDHTFKGQHVHLMNPTQIEEALQAGLSREIVDLYHGEEPDLIAPAIEGISARAKTAIRKGYSDVEALRIDSDSGILLTVKGVTEKAAKIIAANLAK